MGSLFSRICARQPRALQICQRLLEKAARLAGASRSSAESALYQCELGHVLAMQGSTDLAMKAYREASKSGLCSYLSVFLYIYIFLSLSLCSLSLSEMFVLME